jgi:hypothetical protein
MQVYMTVPGGTQFVEEMTQRVARWPCTGKATVHLKLRGLATWYDERGRAWHARRHEILPRARRHE